MIQIQCLGYEIKGEYLMIHVICLTLKKIELMQNYKQMELTYQIVKTSNIVSIMVLKYPSVYVVATTTTSKKWKETTEQMKKTQ